MFSFIRKIIGNTHERTVRRLRPRVKKINNLEKKIKKLSDEEVTTLRWCCRPCILVRNRPLNTSEEPVGIRLVEVGTPLPQRVRSLVGMRRPEDQSILAPAACDLQSER